MNRKRSKISAGLKELRAKLDTKASADMIIDGHQAFFSDLNKVEEKVDKKRDEFIIAEFKRLGDKLVSETTTLHTRLEKLEKVDREELLKRMLDEKLDKTEFTSFVALLREETISPLKKGIDKAKKDIECIEVSEVIEC